MHWKNLQNNKCPKCGEELEFFHSGHITCSRKCGFHISEDRMEELVTKMNAERIKERQPDEHLEELNNL